MFLLIVIKKKVQQNVFIHREGFNFITNRIKNRTIKITIFDRRGKFTAHNFIRPNHCIHMYICVYVCISIYRVTSDDKDQEGVINSPSSLFFYFEII